jgi:hypothetical protein
MHDAGGKGRRLYDPRQPSIGRDEDAAQLFGAGDVNAVIDGMIEF